MDKNELVERGRWVEQVIGHRFFQEAWKRIEKEQVEALVDSSIADRERRDDIQRTLKVMTDLMTVFQEYVRRGRDAPKQEIRSELTKFQKIRRMM